MALMQLSSVEQAAQWLHEKLAASGGQLRTDSRRVQRGDAFIAWPGAATDGRQYVAAALQAGAVACLVEADGTAAFAFDDARVASFAGLKAASGPIAAEFFGHPSRQLDVIAVTGTNGKTSTAWWLAQTLNVLYSQPNQSLSNQEQTKPILCGLIGTLGLGTPGSLVSTGLTTPDPVMLQAEFARLRDAGAKAVAIEASSIGIAEQRLAATAIRSAIFTNFTQDHLDYHRDMEAYWLAKRQLFDWPGLQQAVINIDDPKGEPLAMELASRGMVVWTVSTLRTDAPTGLALWAMPPHYEAGRMHAKIGEGSERVEITAPIVGEYNLANVLGVMATLRSLGLSLEQIAPAISLISAVPGRMERVAADGHEDQVPQVVVDYAHTPDALAKVLDALRAMAASRSGRLWCVFGCGGDRDPVKRPLMAQTAQALADRIVLTSDNPRGESPEAIITDVLHGFDDRSRVHIEPDRARAIRETIERADPHDVVLLAGKGHEDYQEIQGVKHPFSDISKAQEALQAYVRKINRAESAT